MANALEIPRKTEKKTASVSVVEPFQETLTTFFGKHSGGS